MFQLTSLIIRRHLLSCGGARLVLTNYNNVVFSLKIPHLVAETHRSHVPGAPEKGEGVVPSTDLTQRRVNALKPRRTTYDVRDSDLKGFRVRIPPSGHKRYFPCRRRGSSGVLRHNPEEWVDPVP